MSENALTPKGNTQSGERPGQNPGVYQTSFYAMLIVLSGGPSQIPNAVCSQAQANSSPSPPPPLPCQEQRTCVPVCVLQHQRNYQGHRKNKCQEIWRVLRTEERAILYTQLLSQCHLWAFLGGRLHFQTRKNFLITERRAVKGGA